MPSSSQFFRRFASLACLVMIGLVAAVAGAAGRVQWKSTKLKETSGKAWNVECSIFLARKPDVAHVPMKFEFEPISYFERAMVDGKEGVIERTVPLSGRQSLIESVDVGFMDPGSGQIQTRTKFTFKVTRAHGYEAGEYKVTIRGENGNMIGTPSTLTFDGENEVIDRRSIVFTGEKKKKKSDDKKDDKGESGEKSDEKKDEGSSSDKPAAESKDDTVPTSDDKEEGEPSPGDAPDEVNGKPGGCGCEVPGSTPLGAPSALGGLLLASLLVLRRRRV